MGKTTNPVSVGDGKISAPVDAKPEIRAGIEQTRLQMSGTLDAIEQKLAPGHIKAQVMEQLEDARVAVKAQVKEELREVKDAVKEQFQQARVALRQATLGKVENMANEARSTVIGTIRENPIPAALAGIGLAWLFMNRRSSPSTRSFGDYPRGDYPRHDDGRSLGYGGLPERGVAAQALGQVQEKAGTLLENTKQAVGGLAEGAQHQAHRIEEGLEHAVASGKESLADLARGAQSGARRVERRLEDLLHSSPVGVGVAALALGTVTGLLLPRTSREDMLMGDTRDQLVHKAQAVAEGALDKVQDLAKDATAPIQNGSYQSPSPAGRH